MAILRTSTLAALIGVALGDEYVITGTASNWASLHEEHKDGFLAEFYAPWCGHCKKLAPEYEKAAQMLDNDKSKVKLVKVDATVESSLGQKYEVSGYPSLKWFVGGEPSDYDGPREAVGIVNWIKTMTGPAVVDGEPAADAPVSVTYYNTEVGFFEDIAKSNRKKAAWHFVTGSGGGKVVIKHKGEDAIEKVCGDKETLESFFKSNAVPLYGAMDGETYGNYIASGTGMVWTLLPMTTETVTTVVDESRAMMTSVAKKLRANDSGIAVSWTNTIEFAKVLEGMFGITEFPRLVVNKKMGDKQNFIYNGEMTEEAIMAYITQVQAGEVKPHLKSETPPEPNDAPVKIVTGKTLESMVFTADKDVLLEVYAPWCGHCKNLEPEYLKVAKKVVKEEFTDIITIAKMDGTLNDSPVESITWTGFPTIVYVKAGSPKVITYDGGRDAKGIWKWIKSNHSQKDLIKERLQKKQAEKAAAKDDNKENVKEEEKKEEKKEEL